MTKRALKRMVREGDSSHADSRYDDAKIRRLPVSGAWSPLGANDEAARDQAYVKTIKPKSEGQTELIRP